MIPLMDKQQEIISLEDMEINSSYEVCTNKSFLGPKIECVCILKDKENGRIRVRLLETARDSWWNPCIGYKRYCRPLPICKCNGHIRMLSAGGFSRINETIKEEVRVHSPFRIHRCDGCFAFFPDEDDENTINAAMKESREYEERVKAENEAFRSMASMIANNSAATITGTTIYGNFGAFPWTNVRITGNGNW